MSAKVKVGDTVCLNDDGLKNCYGYKQHGLQHMKTLEMKITEVGPASLTYPEESYQVYVDNEEIDDFLLFDWCFDVVEHNGGING